MITSRALVFILLFAVQSAFAVSAGSMAGSNSQEQRNEFARIDAHALDVPRSKSRSLKRLVPYLVQPAQTETEKARAIYRWITENIAYDTKSYFSGRYRNRRVKTSHVLKRRRGVCDAYASLFRDMAKMAGLKVAKISGFAKGWGYEPGSADSNENHAWNAVRADGRWYLVDATWGAGYIDKKTRRFKKRFRDFYFLSSPQEFIYSHFPREEQWQLLHQPRTFNQFNQTVLLKPEFFEKGLRLDSHDQAVIDARGELNLSLYVPEDSEIMANLFKSGTPLDRHHFYWERNRNKTAIKVIFPRAGEYSLRVYARDKYSSSDFPRVVEYKIRARGESNKSFPMFHNAYFENDIRIDSHKEGVIYTDGQLEMLLTVPRGVELSARLQQDRQVLSRDLVFEQREGNKYRIRSLFPEAGEYALQFFSQSAKSNKKVSTLEYTVVAERGKGELRFPTRYKKYLERDAYLYSPINSLLPSGNPEYFKIRVPGAVVVAVTMGDQWYFLKKKGNVFYGNVPIVEGEITIVASFTKDKSKYSSLLKYDGI